MVIILGLAEIDELKIKLCILVEESVNHENTDHGNIFFLQNLYNSLNAVNDFMQLLALFGRVDR